MSDYHATITRYAPGYMYDVDICHEGGIPVRGYGTVTYTLWGARLAARRLLKQAKKDSFADGYSEEVRL